MKRRCFGCKGLALSSGSLGVFVAIVAVLTPIGCSLTDTSDLANGAKTSLVKDGGGWPDVSAPPSAVQDAAPASFDASDDATALEAGGGGNGERDASVGGDDASAPDTSTPVVDAGTVVFKDDFESAHSTPGLWDDQFTQNGALSLDRTIFQSPVTGLMAASQSIGNGGFVNAVVEKRFPMPAAGVTASYEVSVYISRIDSHGADGVIAALQLLDSAGDKFELQIDTKVGTDPTSLVTILGEYMGYANGTSSFTPQGTVSPLRLSAWNRLRVELVNAMPYVARVYFDDVLQVQASVPLPVTPSQVQLSCGLSFVRPPSDAWTVSYDDVVYRLK